MQSLHPETMSLTVATSLFGKEKLFLRGAEDFTMIFDFTDEGEVLFLLVELREQFYGGVYDDHFLE